MEIDFKGLLRRTLHTKIIRGVVCVGRFSILFFMIVFKQFPKDYHKNIFFFSDEINRNRAKVLEINYFLEMQRDAFNHLQEEVDAEEE